MSDTPQPLPRHVAIIMDGNGRWAKARGLTRNEGHRAGAESAYTVAKCCVDQGIAALTLYAFSTENWSRPKSEVRYLMSNLRRFLREKRDDFAEYDVRLRAVGAVDELPTSVLKELRRTEEATKDCSSLTLAVALNYGGRRELTDVARSIARDVAAGELSPEDVNEQAIEDRLYTAGLPPLDLLIRTAGEMRVSNFLLWQLSYAELYVTDTLWPDFGEGEFLAALREFAARERRFGGLKAGVRKPDERKDS
jgi:undecaprenyl diphosphate synthase